MRLYDLAEQYNDLLDVLEGSENPEAVYAMLEGLDGKFEEKVESTVKIMRSKESESEALTSEANRLLSRAERAKKEAKWLRDNIEMQMIRTNKEHVKSSLFDIKFKLNPPAVNVLNESIIPRSYFITKPPVVQLDKRSVMDAMKSGEVIPGVEIMQGKSLQIK